MTPFDLAALTANMREEDKMRIYLVSMLAVSEAETADDPTKMLAIYYHTPSLIEAQSINMAVEIAKHQIEELWPKAQGWKLRSISVAPFEPESVKLMLQYWQSGLLATKVDPPETGVNVNLDATDSQSSILVEDDKPAS